MTDVFVAEIDGRALIALNAAGPSAAQTVLDDPAVRFDLQSFRRGDGKPIWNGTATLSLREAEPSERELWESSFRDAIAASGAAYDEAIGETWICWLVAVAQRVDG